MIIEPIKAPAYDLDRLLDQMTHGLLPRRRGLRAARRRRSRVAVNYAPVAGDVVWLQFDPQAGHEPAGHRPALVLSPARYNALRSMHLLSGERGW